MATFPCQIHERLDVFGHLQIQYSIKINKENYENTSAELFVRHKTS